MYNKLFTKILDSSIWLENQSTRIVWITFIACMDQDGVVALSSVGNVSNRARVSLEEAEAAIHCLESPDIYNPDQEQEGRRIERIPGVGWIVLNAQKYRDIIKAETARAQTRERTRAYRERQKEMTGDATVTVCDENVTLSEAEALSPTNEIRDAWTGKPKDIESPNRPSSPESDQPAAEIFIGTVLASVTKELGLTKLSVTAQRDWSNHALLAFENNFTTEQFLECFRLLRGQTWRNSPVQPKHVTDGLPELAKLRREGKQNGSTEKLPTLAEKLADDQANRQNLRKAPTAI